MWDNQDRRHPDLHRLRRAGNLCYRRGSALADSCRRRYRPLHFVATNLILIMIVLVIGMAIALERYIARGLLAGAIKG